MNLKSTLYYYYKYFCVILVTKYWLRLIITFSFIWTLYFIYTYMQDGSAFQPPTITPELTQTVKNEVTNHVEQLATFSEIVLRDSSGEVVNKKEVLKYLYNTYNQYGNLSPQNETQFKEFILERLSLIPFLTEEEKMNTIDFATGMNSCYVLLNQIPLNTNEAHVIAEYEAQYRLVINQVADIMSNSIGHQKQVATQSSGSLPMIILPVITSVVIVVIVEILIKISH